jgi:hypothetical protein
MKLLGYKKNASGFKGLIDRLIRFRLSIKYKHTQFRLEAKYSHVEILFEPNDCVDEYLPDKISNPKNGAYWCASSSGMDIMPKYSIKRQGEIGGVRFKRINPNPRKWDIIDISDKDAVKAVQIFNKYEGCSYDYKLALSYLVFFIKQSPDKMICSEICAEALGYKQAWKYDPCLLMNIVNDRT